ANYRREDAVAGAVAAAAVPERSLKRRFKAATGTTLIARVQNLRIEEAKRLLEAGDRPADDIAAEVGYDNAAFFRRLFKRTTGLTPGAYRRMFQPLAGLDGPSGGAAGIGVDGPIPWGYVCAPRKRGFFGATGTPGGRRLSSN